MVLLAVGIGLLLLPVALVPWEPPVAAAYTAILVSVGVVVGAWVWRFSLGAVEATPEETVAYLVRRLRTAGHLVHVEPPELTVAIGDEALVRMRVEPAEGRSRILYRADTTIVGWLSMVRLPGIYRRVRAWGRVAAVVPPGGRLPPPPPSEDAQATLVNALSETHRLAAEAYASERERYQNSQALIIIAAITVWFLLFLGLSSMSADADFNRRMLSAAGLAFAATLSVSIPGGWLVRRFRRGQIVRLQEWTVQLQDALRLESAPQAKADREGSSLELLLKSHGEVPRWLDAARRASMSVDPMGWWAVFAMVYVAVDLLLWDAPAFASFSLPLGVILGIAGAAILAAAVVYFRRWRRRREATLARNVADWDLSYERLRGELESYLGRL